MYSGLPVMKGTSKYRRRRSATDQTGQFAASCDGGDGDEDPAGRHAGAP